jgi:hypothetical protein
MKVLAASGQAVGKTCRSAQAGTTLRILGHGFGKKPESVAVLFDDVSVDPFPEPFSSSELLVTAPLLDKPTKSLMVQVGRRKSETIAFSLRRTRKYRGQPGEPTRQLFTAVDRYAALAAALARTIGSGGPVTPADVAQLFNAAAAIDGLRSLAQHSFEQWMEWLPLQEDQRFEPLRTIAFYDTAVVNADLVGRMNSLIEKSFGPGSPLETIIPGGSGAIFSAPPNTARSEGEPGSEAESGFTFSIGNIGFIIHEVVKFVEGMENLFKLFKPSAEAGAAVANVDVEVSLGEIFSAIAKLVDIIAQVLQKIGSSQSAAEQKAKIETIIRGLEQLEQKADRGEGKLDQMGVKLEEINERTKTIEAEAKANNGALRELGDLLGRTLTGGVTAADGSVRGWIIDPRQTRTGNPVPDRDVKQELHDIEDKIDRLESKADRHEEKLDRQEEKLDRQEEKLDREEEKLDHFAIMSPPHEGSVASQRDGGNRVSAVMVAIRRQDDKVYLRAAIDVKRGDLDDPLSWTDWIDFGRPQNAASLQSVSVDLQYEDNSNVEMNGLLSVRDSQGWIFHREFDGPSHNLLATPAHWSDWTGFLDQP